MRECITHHHACDCREEKFKKLETENKKLLIENKKLLIENKELWEVVERVEINKEDYGWRLRDIQDICHLVGKLQKKYKREREE